MMIKKFYYNILLKKSNNRKRIRYLKDEVEMNYYFYDTPIGKITITEENDHIEYLDFGDRFDLKNGIEFESELLIEADRQLKEYFSAERKVFDLPMNPKGTPFMKSVWKQLTAIPYGKTVSYKDISRAIDHPKAYRAVGLANNKNPLPIFIPCHRVIASNGDLCGYAGGVSIKQYLLNLEKGFI